MCEVLIRVQDKTEPNHPLRALRTQRGDVIAVQPDGWPWSKRELTNLAWRVVRLPGLPMDALGDLQQPAYDRDGMIIAKRARGLDLDSISDVTALFKSGEVVELSPEVATRLVSAAKNYNTGAKEIG